MPEGSANTLLGKPLGIFGGTFDPVHYGHLRLAEEAVDALDLGAVRWIPAGQPARRTSPRVDAAQRLKMVRLAVAGNSRFELDSAEVDAAQPSYTVTTLERLRRPDVLGTQRPLVLLLGADAFAGLEDWHRWASLFDLAHIAIAHRPGFPVDADQLPAQLSSIFRARCCVDPAALNEAPAGCIVTFAMTQLDISATKIRTLLSKGLSVRYLMPEAAIDFIQTHHLYTET